MKNTFGGSQRALMPKKIKEIVIPKEDAVFWLDKHGRWNNAHGVFQHRKIIDFFHSSIKRDEKGYHLSQTNGNAVEKVYFHHEDTALFVFDVILGEPIILVLNTGNRVALDPENLFVQDDNLYLQMNEDRVKFTADSLLKLSGYIEFDNEACYISLGNRRHRIKSR